MPRTIEPLVSMPSRAVGVTEALVRELRRVVGRTNVLHELVDLQTYEYDAYGERSLPGAVVFVQFDRRGLEHRQDLGPREGPLRPPGLRDQPERRLAGPGRGGGARDGAA